MTHTDLNKWKLITLGCVVGPPLLVGWMYPLLPKSTSGWAFSIGAGALVGAWAVGGAMLIGWLQRQSRYRLLCQLTEIAVAASLGAVIFWVAYEKQAMVALNFSYFGR